MMLEPGYYANVFGVKVDGTELRVVTSNRSAHPSLRELREEIACAGKKAEVYAPHESDKVYGYGSDVSWLKTKGFCDTSVMLNDEPRLAGRMILDGVVGKMQRLGYTPVYERHGRCEVHNWAKPEVSGVSEVRVFKGYDLRVIFLHDDKAGELAFGLIVDTCYALQDLNGQRVGYQEIRERLGANALRAVRQTQRDLIPTGMNTEVSRQRLVEDVLPMVQRLGTFELSGGVAAQVTTTPLRIVVGARNGTLW